MSSRIVMIHGGPATGKSTLAEKLRTEFQLGVLSKDGLKEFFFDSIGLPSDKVESRLYNMATFNAQFAAAEVLVAGGKDFIFEGAFHTDIASLEMRRLSKVPGVRIVQLYCTAETAIQVSRYNDRIKHNSRHEGHNEAVQQVDGGFADVYQPLDMEPTIIYDTTAPSESQYNRVVEAIKQFLETN